MGGGHGQGRTIPTHWKRRESMSRSWAAAARPWQEHIRGHGRDMAGTWRRGHVHLALTSSSCRSRSARGIHWSGCGGGGAPLAAPMTSSPTVVSRCRAKPRICTISASLSVQPTDAAFRRRAEAFWEVWISDTCRSKTRPGDWIRDGSDILLTFYG